MKVKHFILSIAAAAFLTSAMGVDNTLEVGRKAPKIETVDGTNVVYDANSEGKTKVVNFWSPRKPGSRIANQELSRQYGSDQDTDFISICIDTDENLMKEVLKQDGLTDVKNYAACDISPRVFKDYEVEKNTRTVMIGPDGKISKLF